MIEVATYYSKNYCPQWLAFIILPNGKYWDVRFSGATEEEAKQKALSLWEVERGKLKIEDDPCIDNAKAGDPWTNPSQHHLTGRIWMINKVTREKKRIPLTEIVMYEQLGWERGGPRSK